MGLGYAMIFLTIAGGAAGAFFLLKAAWNIWNRQRNRAWALLPLLPGLLCAAAALYLIAMIWREGLYHF